MACRYLAGALDEAAEEEGGDLFSASLLELVAVGQAEEGVAGLGDGGEEGAELRELLGAAAVFEGVEVTARGAGSGSSAAALLRSGGWRLIGRGWRHGTLIVARGGRSAKAEVTLSHSGWGNG